MILYVNCLLEYQCNYYQIIAQLKQTVCASMWNTFLEEKGRLLGVYGIFLFKISSAFLGNLIFLEEMLKAEKKSHGISTVE